ncbi:MAG: carboxy terminal-processing peptidase [Bacteroidetes bacterium]|nr:carboxy terminal-processing peptidase [Bacteroidota bacterium]
MTKAKFWLPIGTMSVLVTVLVFCSNKKGASGDSLLVKITNILRQEHYSAPKIDDEFSKKVFQNVVDKLDNDKRFFTAPEIEILRKYETSLDDQIKAGRFDFFDTAWAILMKRLNTIESFANAELEAKYDYTGNETYTIKDKVEKYKENDEALKKDWKLWLKLQSLERLYRKIEAQKNKNSLPDSLKKTFKEQPMDSMEFKARSETKKFVGDWFKRWRKMDRRDQVSFYVNCITEVYDPHTNYFPPEDKANFDISMTGKLEGIGATLSERDGYIKVERIVPGSASYKQGDLKAGDLIIKVAQGAGTPEDVVDMKLDDAIQLIRGKKGTEVRLTVKKPDGSIKVIPIIRDVVVIEESYARSGIVEMDGKKYGLIHLPSFYADFNEKGRGRHASEDIQYELEKLKKEGVTGIVMDLRNNGGGSLLDAIDMGGLFIDQGPIVQVRDPDGKVREGSDAKEGLSWDGPLVLLTNTYSASASEILAAAMQDYKRAVIVGTKSTFGKGTVQTFLPIQGGRSEDFPLGFGQIKVTVQKFYRINGGTTQLRGVIPDVILPDLYDGIPQGEAEMEFHLQYDKIPVASYKMFTGNTVANSKKAITEAQKRVKSNTYYQNVQKRAKDLKKIRDEYVYSLNLESYSKQQENLKAEERKYIDTSYKAGFTSIQALKADLDEVGNDEARKAQRTDWLKAYRKDAGLEQSIFILKDLADGAS